MNNQKTLVRYTTGKECIVLTRDLSAPERCLKDRNTFDYHQIKSEGITRTREFDPPQEPSTEGSPIAETSLSPDPSTEPTLTDTPMEAPPEKKSHVLLRKTLCWNC